MTSAYTQIVVDNGTFYDFAVGCAKAFVIDYRDNPKLPFPPPLPLNNYTDNYNYFETELLVAKRDLEDFKSLNNDVKQKMFSDYQTSEIEYYTGFIKERLELANKYDSMISIAEKLDIPNDDYLAYKRFMIRQLVESKEFDCDIKWVETKLENFKNLTYDEWHSEHILSLNDAINDNEKELSKVKDSNNYKVNWITNLVTILAPYKNKEV